jgi:competence protein ComEC
LLGVLPLLVPSPAGPRDGSLWITAIDIGQGMAVMAQADGRHLLFDTGPSWGGDSDAGSRVILPWLRAQGLGSIDPAGRVACRCRPCRGGRGRC